MPETTLTAPDISCDHCKRTIETELAGLDGVSAVEVTVPARSVRVVYDATAVDEGAIRGRLHRIGYPASA